MFGTSFHVPISNGHSGQSAGSELAPIVSTLLKSSLRPFSVSTYRRAWKLSSRFLHSTLPEVGTGLPISPPRLVLFIAYMYDHHYASSTVNTYISALGYSH